MKLAVLQSDRLDDAADAPRSWQAPPGACEAIARLNRAGWHVVLVGNQPGLEQGTLHMARLHAEHARMHRALADAGARIEAVFYCPHAPEQTCGCRLPAPGLLQQVSERFGVEPQALRVIASRPELLHAGAQLGAHLFWVGDEAPEPASMPPHVPRFTSLTALVEQLLPAEPLPAPAPDALP